tara:strand:+ start:315 stop:536 length:222 start_codon:yes stop_codon:yes gene_type:complete
MTSLQVKYLIMNKLSKIEVGQRISFNYYGAFYTKKVKEVVTRKFNDTISYNVNPIGSGTQYISVDHEDIIEVK